MTASTTISPVHPPPDHGAEEHRAPDTGAAHPSPEIEQSLNDISAVSAWTLRIGVCLSVAVMLLGITLSLARGHLKQSHINTTRFDYHPRELFEGVIHGQARSITDLGIYLLVLTPVTRVALSAFVFAFKEKDWLYTSFTVVVLAMTLAGLLWLG